MGGNCHYSSSGTRVGVSTKQCYKGRLSTAVLRYATRAAIEINLHVKAARIDWYSAPIYVATTTTQAMYIC